MKNRSEILRYMISMALKTGKITIDNEKSNLDLIIRFGTDWIYLHTYYEINDCMPVNQFLKEYSELEIADMIYRTIQSNENTETRNKYYNYIVESVIEQCTKEEIEKFLEPSINRVNKEETKICDEVHVKLPWVNDKKEPIDVLIKRNENGNLVMLEVMK